MLLTDTFLDIVLSSPATSGQSGGLWVVVIKNNKPTIVVASIYFLYLQS